MVRNEDTNFPLQFTPAHKISEYPAIPTFAAGTLPPGRKSRPFPARTSLFQTTSHLSARTSPLRPTHPFSARHIHSTHPGPYLSVGSISARAVRPNPVPSNHCRSEEAAGLSHRKKQALPQRCCGRVGSYNAGCAVGESVVLAARLSACTCGVRAIWRFLPAR